MKQLRKHLREQFAYVESLDRDCDPDHAIDLEVAEIVEESRAGAPNSVLMILATWQPL